MVTEGSDSQQPLVAGVRAVGLHQLGKWRAAAHLRALSQGPQRPGPGRPKSDDGPVPWSNFSRFERLATDDEPIVLDHQVVNHGQGNCPLLVVGVVDTHHHRDAVLLSTDGALEALTLSRYSQARFPIEWLWRDGKPLTGVTAGPARSQAKRALHCNARLSAVTVAKLAARQQRGDAAQSFSMARLQRRACNPHRIDRISAH